MTLWSLLKIAAAPGSLSFLALGCALGLGTILLWPRCRRAGWLWLAALCATYVVLSVPVVARAIASTLPFPTAAPASARIDALIVLGGDNTVGRLRTALDIHRASNPDLIVLSGGDWLNTRLLAGGVPANRLIRNDAPRTTREQMLVVTEMARQTHQALAVVTSRLQAPRVKGLARAAGIFPLVIESPIDVEPPSRGAWQLVPTYSALRLSRDAFYERLALSYYQWRGWSAS